MTADGDEADIKPIHREPSRWTFRRYTGVSLSLDELERIHVILKELAAADPKLNGRTISDFADYGEYLRMVKTDVEILTDQSIVRTVSALSKVPKELNRIRLRVKSYRTLEVTFETGGYVSIYYEKDELRTETALRQIEVILRQHQARQYGQLAKTLAPIFWNLGYVFFIALILDLVIFRGNAQLIGVFSILAVQLAWLGAALTINRRQTKPTVTPLTQRDLSTLRRSPTVAKLSLAVAITGLVVAITFGIVNLLRR